MARFNEILVGRFNRFLQRYLSMKGGPPAASLSTEIQPQFDVDKVPVELRGLLGWTLWGIGNNGQSVATGFTAIRIRNPLNSGAIVVVEKAALVDASPGQVLMIMDGTTTPAALTDLPGGTLLAGTRDPRKSASQPTAVVSITGASVISAFSGNLLDFATVLGSTRIDFIQSHNQEIVVAPGHFLTMFNNVANTALVGTFWWRERAIEEGETIF